MPSLQQRPGELASEELESLALHYHVAVVDARRSASAFADRHLRKALFAPLAPPLLATVVHRVVPAAAAVALIADRDAVDDALTAFRIAGRRRLAGWATTAVLEQCRGDLLSSLEIWNLDAALASCRAGELMILDVRSDVEAEKQPLEGARAVPLERLLARRSPPSADVPLAVFSTGGSRAAVAASWLERDGYRAGWIQSRLGPRRVRSSSQAARDRRRCSS